MTIAPSEVTGEVGCDEPFSSQGARESAHVDPGLALLRRLAQEIGGVEHGKGAKDASVFAFVVEPLPARPRYPLANAEQRLRRRSAEADQDLGRGELDLPPDERQAGLRLLRRRRPVAGRPPGDDVGDIDAPTIQSDGLQHPVEQLSRPSDEGPADAVLVAARRLADEHDPRPRRAVGKHELRRGSFQGAALEQLQIGAQGLEIRATRRRASARRPPRPAERPRREPDAPSASAQPEARREPARPSPRGWPPRAARRTGYAAPPRSRPSRRRLPTSATPRPLSPRRARPVFSSSTGSTLAYPQVRACLRARRPTL